MKDNIVNNPLEYRFYCINYIKILIIIFLLSLLINCGDGNNESILSSEYMEDTFLKGVILDQNFQPLLNTSIEVINFDISTLSGIDGKFIIDLSPSVSYRFKADGKNTILSSHSVTFFEKCIKNGKNYFNFPLILPIINLEDFIELSNQTEGDIINPNFPDVKLNFSPDTSFLGKNQLKIAIIEELFITNPYFDDKENFLYSAVSLLPFRTQLSKPAKITLPNRRNATKDISLKLGALNLENGDIEIIGEGNVTSDGKFIETKTGGITEFSTIFFFGSPPSSEKNITIYGKAIDKQLNQGIKDVAIFVCHTFNIGNEEKFLLIGKAVTDAYGKFEVSFVPNFDMDLKIVGISFINNPPIVKKVNLKLVSNNSDEKILSPDLIFEIPNKFEGIVEGYALNEKNESLSGIIVKLKSQPLGTEFSTITDKSGYYQFPSLPLGNFTITAFNPINKNSGKVNGIIKEEEKIQKIDIVLKDESPLKVLNISPYDKESNVAPNQVVEITFSEKLDPEKVISQNIFLLAPDRQIESSLILSNDMKKVTLIPTFPLLTDSYYTLFILSNITDIDGNPLYDSVTSTFYTIDTIPPYLIDIYPYNDNYVPINSFVKASFSEGIDPVTVNDNSFYITYSNNLKVKGNFKITNNGKEVSFYPEKDLDYNREYTINITQDISDLAKNFMENEVRIKFKTVKDQNLPFVKEVFPKNGEEEVKIDTSIIVTFSEEIDPLSINEDNFKLFLHREENEKIDGKIILSEDNIKATFYPFSNLKFNAEYNVILEDSILDIFGNKLIPFKSNFFTLKDLISPEIISVEPQSGSRNIEIPKEIIVTFSEEIDKETVNKDSFYIEEKDKNKIEGEYFFTTDYKKAKFIPKETFRNGKTYIVTLNTNIKDMAGNNLLKEWIGEFTTIQDSTPLQVLETFPKNNEKDVELSSKIEVYFSKSIDELSIKSSFSLIKEDDLSFIEGLITYVDDNKKIIFDPIDELLDSTTYLIKISKELKDKEGNPLEKEFESRFTTIDKTSPRVVSIKPPDKTLNVELDISIVISFSEPIIPETVDKNSFLVTIEDEEKLLGGVITFSKNYDELTFNPSNLLKANTTYKVLLNDLIEDQNGNKLEIFESTFTTKP